MREPTNLASDQAVPGTNAGPPARRALPNFDFETPDEESMQFLEAQWRRFCNKVGLQEVPDIRAILAAKYAAPPPRRRSHWLVRPFLAVYHWFNAHP